MSSSAERPSTASVVPALWAVGDSEAWRRFRARVESVAASDVPLLIEGESGSGKNLTARTLHALSPRASGPFVEVDLSALSPTLVESELFGHVAGAFTGAARDRSGRFQRAQGGTLVLDGVERLPESLQGKLLRVLQERVVEPVGAEEGVPLDVRIVATSSVALAGRVQQRKFREDLYFRLAVVPLEVPSLRARTGDLEALARYYAERSSARVGCALRALSPAAAERLRAHPWPGNLRELENALERATVLAPRDAARLEEADFAFLAEALDGMAERLAREALAHGLSLGELERALLERALSEQRGNQTAAARQVGLTRRAFDLRRQRHGRRTEDDVGGAEEAT